MSLLLKYKITSIEILILLFSHYDQRNGKKINHKTTV